MANLKKLLVVVKFTTNPTGQIEQLVVASKETYPDRIFFVENTHEIITHGQKYGVSDEIKNHVDQLETAFTELAGFDSSKAQTSEAVISETSLIGKYVLAHASKVEGTPDHGIEVTPNEGDKGTTIYTVDLNASTIIDGATVVLKDGKIASGVQIKYTSKADNAAGMATAVPGTTTGHPILSLVDSKGAYINSVDVNDFIVDGMLEKVEYVADGVDADGNHVGPSIKFEWNTDGKHDETLIPLSNVFKLEQIHTGTEKYLTVKTTTPTEADDPHKGDTEGGICYEVNAVVSDTDLTGVSALAKADDDTYKSGVDTDAELNVALGNVAEGLADAKTVATKFADADKKSADMANDLIARLAALKKELSDKDAEQDATIAELDARITTNEDAIKLLNDADEDKAGSILNSLKKFRASLESDMEIADENELVKVTAAITNGALDATKSKVELKVNTLTVTTDADPEYTIGDVNYKVKALGAPGQENTIAGENPSLVTSQDAWVFGQCIKAQAIKEIASDNNDYIHIVREDNQTKIQFEPWAEVHSMDELKDAITY